MLRFTVLFLLFIKLQDPVFNEKEVYGTWRWIESSGGLMEHRITQENVNVTKKIVFTQDHIIMYYVGDSVTYKTHYQIQNERTLFTTSPVPVLRLSGLVRTQSITIAGSDTLRLRDNAYDGYVQVYLRLRD